jgi:hypothetical protein
LLSPLAAVVLVEADGQQRGAGQQVRRLFQGLQVGLKGRQFVLLVAQVEGLELPLLPLLGVELRRQYRHTAAADVFAHHAAVHLENAVVIAPLPAHRLCYLKSIAPLASKPQGPVYQRGEADEPESVRRRREELQRNPEVREELDLSNLPQE